MSGADLPTHRDLVYLAPGRLFASAEAVQVATILGSCVAVCLWDSEARVGGMNHFLLPRGLPASPRFGDSAVPLLIRGVLDLGARKSRLRARLVGGACVLATLRSDSSTLGARNVEAAREQLRAEQIQVVGEHVGGDRGRKLLFHVQTGAASIRPIEAES